MPDKYDEAIAYLSEHPSEIYEAWNSPWTHRAGCLFVPLSKSRKWYDGDQHCGCPTMVKAGYWVAVIPELTDAVRDNKNIPSQINQTEVKHLPAFAEIQRLADKVLERD